MQRLGGQVEEVRRMISGVQKARRCGHERPPPILSRSEQISALRKAKSQARARARPAGGVGNRQAREFDQESVRERGALRPRPCTKMPRRTRPRGPSRAEDG